MGIAKTFLVLQVDYKHDRTHFAYTPVIFFCHLIYAVAYRYTTSIPLMVSLCIVDLLL